MNFTQLAHKRLAFTCAAIWFSFVNITPLLAEITIASPFSSHAVIQRDKPAPIWGTSDPGAAVTVTFADQTKTTVADANGKWHITLDPLTASAEPRDLVARDPSSSARSSDVLVGDVWLCSGQSNMGFRVFRADNSAAEIAAANFPGIRCLDVPMIPSAAPADNIRAPWRVCSPEYVAQFSAVAYYFAREVHQTTGVPIGIITSSWGGTQVESWMNEAALKKDPAYAAILARWAARVAGIPEEMRRHAIRIERWRVAKEKALAEGVEFTEQPRKEPEGEVSRWTPSGLYNGMIHPLVPMALKGVIWYQGETNAGRPAEYRTLFPAMIEQWRETFGQENLPFYFVQIANWKRAGDDVAVAYLREAQMEALKLPDTGMAVSIDVGNPNDVHPTNKQAVGKRLALAALGKTYGKAVVYTGPTFREAKIDGDRVRLSFDDPKSLVLNQESPGAFELAGEDRTFHPAEAVKEGDFLIVSSSSVPKPISVRYAFRNAPPTALYNTAGLPATPFRTDDWPYVPPVDPKETVLP